MNRKVWIGFIAVYIVMNVTNMIIHMGLLSSVYASEPVMKIMRPAADGKTWIYFLTSAFTSFFFSLIFSKGYEGKGIAEGLRYGLYVGLMMVTPMAYASYAMYPVPYSLAMQWFLYGMVQYLILGVVVALISGSKPKVAAST